MPAQIPNVAVMPDNLVGDLTFSETEITFTYHDSDRIDTYSANDVKDINWFNVTKEINGLAIHLNNQNRVTFHGVRSKFLDDIDQEVQAMGHKLTKVSLACEGWNFGEIKMNDHEVTFATGADNFKEAFALPISSISQANTMGKTDTIIQFDRDSTAKESDIHVCEMRFFVPQSTKSEMNHEYLANTLSSLSSSSSTSTTLASFSQMPCVMPKGRFDIEFTATSLNLRGATQRYRILPSHISRLFVLPMPTEDRICVVASVEPPLRQGATQYGHIVTVFDKDDNSAVEEFDAEEVEKIAGEKWSAAKFEGPRFQSFAHILSMVTKLKVTTPGNVFTSNGVNAVKCSLKANDGFLFPLKKSFFFLNKATEVRFDQISHVEFQRVSSVSTGVNVSFDLAITLHKSVVTFTNIHRDEYDNLVEYCKERGLRIRNLKELENAARAAVTEEVDMGGDDDDDDDQSVQMSDSQSEGDEEYDEHAGSDGEPASDAEESGKRKPAAASGSKKKKKEDVSDSESDISDLGLSD